MQYLIDASVYVFRAYYSMPDDMVDDTGNPINALYGFCRFLGDFMEQVTPEFEYFSKETAAKKEDGVRSNSSPGRQHRAAWEDPNDGRIRKQEFRSFHRGLGSPRRRPWQ